MPSPIQPEFPPVAGSFPELGSIPQLNSALGMPSMFHQPQMPRPGHYAVPPPAMHGGPQLPYGFSDVFAAGRHMQNPGNVGFQAAQGIPFFGQSNSMAKMGLNLLANQGMQMLAKNIPGMESLADGMIPFGGLQTSRYDFQRMRERQELSNHMFEGPNGLYATNPELQLIGGMGIGNNKMGQMGVGLLTGYKTRFESFYGNMGRAFSGGEDERAKSAFQAMSGIDVSMTMKGGGVDYNLTQGRDRQGFQDDLTAAYRRGAFVSNQDIFGIADGVAREDKEGYTKKGRKLVGDISNVMALGRDVFGQDSSADDIVSNLENVFGREGVTDAGQAAQRLREVEAAAQVLNTDGQTVAKYMQVMKQLTRNVGLVGEAGTDASLGMMLNNEAGVRFGQNRNINTDKEGMMTDTITAMERNMNSQDANQKEALVQVLQTSQKDVLAGLNLNVGGKNMTGLQLLNKVNSGLNNENMSFEQRAEFESLLQAGATAVNTAGGPMGRSLAGRLRDRAANPQNELTNIFDQVRGQTGYKEFAARSGLFMNQIDVIQNAKKRTKEQLGSPGSSIRGGRKYSGDGLDGLIDDAQEAGFFTALQSGDIESARTNLRKQLGGDRISDDQFDAAASALEVYVMNAKQYPGQSHQEVLGAMGTIERAKKGGSVLKEFREAEDAIEVFTRTAGGLPTSPGALGKRGIQALLREIGSGEKLSKERLGNLLGEVAGSKKLDAFHKIFSGEEVVLDGSGNPYSWQDLLTERGNISNDTTKSKRDKQVAKNKLTLDFWKKVGEQEHLSDIRDDLGMKSGAGGEGGEAANPLGNAVVEMWTKFQGAQTQSFKELKEVLNKIHTAVVDLNNAKAE